MPTCQGRTRDGRPCSREVKDGALYCWQHEPGKPMTVPAIFRRLAQATPEEKTDIVLQLIEEHPEGRLELPAHGRVCADLRGVDLSRDTLKARCTRLKVESPSWWSSDSQGAFLVGATLQGADLRGANLQGAQLDDADLQNGDLTHANLQHALLWETDLQGAILRDTNLRGASLGGAGLQHTDLTHANLQHANLTGADLQGADLADASVDGANLQHAKLRDAHLQDTRLVGADLQRAFLEYINLQHSDLTGIDLRGANLTGANLQDTRLRDANLQDATLESASLQRADLTNANLQQASLTGADLRGADLTGADLQQADLRDTRLQGVTLSSCNINHIYISGAQLDRTRFQREQLGGAIGEELAGEYRQARQGYLALKQNFDMVGDRAAASWAYRKERRMEKLIARHRARTAHSKREWRAVISNYVKFAGDQLVEIVCDYGESAWRVAGSLIAVWIGFAVMYGLVGGVQMSWQPPNAGQITHITRNPLDLLSFSLGAMTTREAPGLAARSTFLMRVLMPLETLLGVFLAGLLGFVAGKRIQRS